MNMKTIVEAPVDILAVLRSRDTAWKVAELAKLLSMGRRTIYDLIDRGALPSIRVGAVVRINPVDALEMVLGTTSI